MTRFAPEDQRLWHRLAEVSRDTPPVVYFDSLGPICEGCGMHHLRLMVGSAVLVVQIERHEVAKMINGAVAGCTLPPAHCRRDTCPPPLRIGGVA